MCDFRKIIGVIIDGKQIDINTIQEQHFLAVPNDGIDAPAGLYHVGASGCGYYYYDGQYWYSDYKYRDVKTCEFVIEAPQNPIPQYIDQEGWDTWEKMKMANYYDQHPCPECGRIGCCDENGLTGISCWAKRNPPYKRNTDCGPKKEG